MLVLELKLNLEGKLAAGYVVCDCKFRFAGKLTCFLVYPGFLCCLRLQVKLHMIMLVLELKFTFAGKLAAGLLFTDSIAVTCWNWRAVLLEN